MIYHLVPGLPFGGVGESGLGAYTRKASYDCFTHRKSEYMHINHTCTKISHSKKSMAMVNHI